MCKKQSLYINKQNEVQIVRIIDSCVTIKENMMHFGTDYDIFSQIPLISLLHAVFNKKYYIESSKFSAFHPIIDLGHLGSFSSLHY